MSTLRTIQVALGIPLVTLFGLAVGCASMTDTTAKSDDASLGESQEAIDLQPQLPSGCLSCTVSSEFSSTGRAWGSICLTNQPGICCRRRIGGEAPPLYPSCHSVGKEQLGCFTVIDC